MATQHAQGKSRILDRSAQPAVRSCSRGARGDAGRSCTSIPRPVTSLCLQAGPSEAWSLTTTTTPASCGRPGAWRRCTMRSGFASSTRTRPARSAGPDEDPSAAWVARALSVGAGAMLVVPSLLSKRLTWAPVYPDRNRCQNERSRCPARCLPGLAEPCPIEHLHLDEQRQPCRPSVVSPSFGTE
jgi:hypothetical protein